MNDMNQRRLIILILSNFGNFCRRFGLLLIHRKNAIPSLSVNLVQAKPETSEISNTIGSVIIEARNGLLLKVNGTYYPLRKNEVHRRVNLSQFTGEIVEFELISAFRREKLSLPNRVEPKQKVERFEAHEELSMVV